jgi:hypothetical protein
MFSGKEKTTAPYATNRSVADEMVHVNQAFPAVPALQKKDLEEKKLPAAQFQTDELKEPVTQGRFVIQQTPGDLEEEMPKGTAQGKFVLQKKDNDTIASPNLTGMPNNLKTGIENLSGMAMDDVKVHYNSEKPAQLNALAYAQGNDIHIGAGQEQHLPHEAWHVVQQRQGRVQPTMQLKDSIPVNDDPGLEQEATVMGAKAME